MNEQDTIRFLRSIIGSWSDWIDYLIRDRATLRESRARLVAAVKTLSAKAKKLEEENNSLKREKPIEYDKRG